MTGTVGMVGKGKEMDDLEKVDRGFEARQKLALAGYFYGAFFQIWKNKKSRSIYARTQCHVINPV